MVVEGKAVQRILIVEDHTAFRQTLALVFDQEPDFEVVAQTASLSETRDVIQELRDGVDLGVIDLTLPDGEGVDLIKELRAASREFAALILTASLDRSEYARAVEAGASGILHKSADVEEILVAVRRLSGGETLFSQDELLELLRLAGTTREETRKARKSIERLTPREMEVLEALAEGLSNKEIAQKLYMSLDTERTHMTNVLNKLGVHSRLQALLFAVRHGVIELR